MNLSDVVEQLYDLSVDGYFNGQKFTKRELNKYIKRMFDSGSKKLIMEMALPDGKWFFEINSWKENMYTKYDYYIPETRECEIRLKEKID